MTCKDVQLILHVRAKNNDYKQVSQSVLLHLGDCEECSHFWSDLLLKKEMSFALVPKMPAGFDSSAITHAAAKYRRSWRTRYRYVPAIAASIAALIGVALFFSKNTILRPHLDNSVASAALPIAEDKPQFKHLNIVFETNSYKGETLISISMSENVEIKGYPNVREVSWSTQLLKGKNVLRLPYRLSNSVAGGLRISYQADGVTNTIQFDVGEEYTDDFVALVPHV